MKQVLVALAAAAALAAPAGAAAPPVMVVFEDGGGQGTTCAWNPYARIQCGPANCWWTGQWEWFDVYGNPTGAACA